MTILEREDVKTTEEAYRILLALANSVASRMGLTMQKLLHFCYHLGLWLQEQILFVKRMGE